MILDLHIEGEATDDVDGIEIHPLVLFQVENPTTAKAVLFSFCGFDEDFSFLMTRRPRRLEPEP